jgi:molybdate transport system ATP-binding protein
MSPTIDIRLTLPRADFTLSVDLQLPGRGITVIYGASGSGKTSLLRAVAGLERPNGARIAVGQTFWHDDAAGVYLPTWRRPIGYVFQEASLLPHLNVRQNLCYGLPAGQDASGLEASIDLLALGPLMQRSVHALSGGERQRVAIGRALATQPSLLLLDEPLAAIDTQKRAEVMPWLERLRDQLGIPALYVTHNTEEVTRLADHLVVLHRGTVKASGEPNDVLTNAALNLQLGDDLGAVIRGTVVDSAPQWQMAAVRFSGGDIWVVDATNTLRLGQTVNLRMFAKDISIALDAPSPERRSSIQNILPATIIGLDSPLGQPFVLVSLRCGEARMLARITRRALESLGLTLGQTVHIQIKSVAMVA